MNRTQLRLCAAILVTLGLVVMLTAQSGAHYKRVNYSFKNHSCEGNNVKDPITLAYHGTGATAKRAIRDVQAHARWKNDDPDSLGWLNFFHTVRDKHTSGCDRQDGERSNNAAWAFGRFHTRFFKSYHQSPRSARKVFMAPHKELLTAAGKCKGFSHAVEPGHFDPNRKDKYYKSKYYSGFDNGRDTLLNRIVSHPRSHRRHRVEFRQWRNTRSAKQCYRDWTSGSSGAMFWIKLGR